MYSIKNRYFISLISVILIFLMIWLIFPICFETNDDSSIMYIIAGYRSGSIEIDPIFSGILWGGIVGGMYYLFPQVAWYTIFSIMVIGISQVIILEGALRRKKCVGTLLLYFIVFISFSLYSSVLLQFTTTALWPGIAACVLGMNLLREENRKLEFFDTAMLIILMILCFSIRKYVGIAVIVFLGTVFLINIINDDKKRRKKLAFIFGLACLMSLFTAGLNVIYEKNDGWHEWREYHKERATYMDYASAGYEEAEEIYTEIGWNESLYNLVNRWFFMDTRVNRESFRKLNQYSHQDKETITWDKFKRGYVLLKEFLKSQHMAVILASGEFVLFLFLLGAAHNKKLFLQAILIAGVSGLLLLYLCLKGRLLLRVFQICVLPAIIIMWMMILGIDRCEKCKHTKYINFVIVIIGLIYMVGSIGYTYKVSTRTDTGVQMRMDMEAYAVENPENIYVYGISMNYGTKPFVVYPKVKPTNYIFWGGIYNVFSRL